MAIVAIMVLPTDGSGSTPRPMVDGDTVANLNAGSGMDDQIATDLNYGATASMVAAGLAEANDGGSVAKAARVDHVHAANFGAAGDMAAAGIAPANAAGSSVKPARTDHVHALTYAEVKAAVGAANSSLAMNSQKITGLLAGSAASDALRYDQASDPTLRANLVSGGVVALGDLQKVSLTPGVSSSHACDVVGVILNTDGTAITGARQVAIGALSVTGGTGKNVLAAASAAVGTIESSAGGNAAAGPSFLTMTTDATGHFSFKITDSSNEACTYWVLADGCRCITKTVNIAT